VFVVLDGGENGEAETHAMRSTYYAVSPDVVARLMNTVGFERVTQIDDAFFQPVLVGIKPS